jgi:hypothetical protein
MMGPWSAIAIEQDGSVTNIQFGQNLPRPDWVPVYPNTSIVQGSRSQRLTRRPDFTRSIS